MRLVPTDSLTLHPEASRVPEMSGEQFASFVNDVAERGLRQPIEIIDEIVIVDGRSRWQAAKQLGMDSVAIVEAALNGDDAVVYMLRAATNRRHLTPDQLACLAQEEMEILAAASRRKRARAAGLAGGRGRGKELPDSSPITSSAEQSRDRSDEIRNVVALRYGVSHRKIRYAQVLKRESPKAYESVKAGNERLVVAKRKLDRQTAQEQLAEKAKAAMRDPAAVSWEIRHCHYVSYSRTPICFHSVFGKMTACC